MVHGDAGVGKSRLVAALGDEVCMGSTCLLELHGSPFHVDAGFHPVRRWSRRAATSVTTQARRSASSACARNLWTSGRSWRRSRFSLPVLAIVYDAATQFTYHTKNQGHDIINGPYFVLMGGLTTETSFDLQKNHIIQSGFARRTIFQYGEEVRHPAGVSPRRGDHAGSAQLDHRALPLSKPSRAKSSCLRQPAILPGVVGLALTQLCRRTAPPHVKSWANSKSVQVLKIAMLTSIAESHDLLITPRHIQSALDLFENMEKDLYSIFGGTGRNELASIAVKIANHLRAQESALELRMLRNRFFTECRPPNDFDECITHLRGDGERCSTR